MAKVRSPNYPVMDLGSALEAVRPAWKADHRNKMSRSVLAKHMGYGSLNGRALGKIGAIRAYGLIDGSADELRISDDAIIALTAPDKTDQKYRGAMQRLALKSMLFQELRKDNPGTLPSEENLKFQLVQRNFTEDAAGKAAKTFLATMRLVSDDSGDYSPVVEEDDAQVEDEMPATVQQEAGGRRLTPEAQAALAGFRKPPTMLEETFILDEGPVTLAFPAKLSAASYEDLEDHLQIFLRKAKRRAEALRQLNTESGDPDSNEVG